MTCLDGAGGKQSFAALPFPWRSRSGTGPSAVHWLEAWGYGKPRRPGQHVVTSKVVSLLVIIIIPHASPVSRCVGGSLSWTIN